MARTSYKTKQEVIDAIKAMREYRLDGKFHRVLKRSWA